MWYAQGLEELKHFGVKLGSLNSPIKNWAILKIAKTYFFHFTYFLLSTFYNCIVQVRFLPWEIRVAFPGESQLWQSRATQPTVHAGCFSISIIHQTLTWTTGSLTCTKMLMHAIAHGVYGHMQESLPWKLSLGEKSLAAPGNWTCVSSMTVRCSNQLSYIPILMNLNQRPTAGHFTCFVSSLTAGQNVRSRAEPDKTAPTTTNNHCNHPTGITHSSWNMSPHSSNHLTSITNSAWTRHSIC